MVVYGVITTKGSPRDQEVTGKAVLKGHILGKKIEHSIPITFNPAVTSSPASLPTIHHLAAKALIKDWQDQDKNKEEIVKLSVESSVISSHTTFIAVDEENSEPVAGAMKTWDATAPYMYFPWGVTGGGQGRGATAVTYRSRRSVKGAVHKKKAIPKKKAAPRKKTALPRKYKVVKDKSASLVSHSQSHLQSQSRSRSRSPIAKSRSSMSLTIDLNEIITAQQANGSWTLDTAVACMQGKSLTVIKSNCPIECEGVVAAVWATVLILTLLRKKYSSQQDEWELIAMKAESWMKKQALPTRVTIQDLYTAAIKLS